MAAQKNKAKNPSTKQGYSKRIHWLELPPELVQSLRRNRKGNQIHRVVNNVGVTRTWAPTTSRRCGRERRWPQLRIRRADESAYVKYFAAGCPFTAERAARVEDEIKFKNYTQSSEEKYEATLVDPFYIRRDPLLKNIEISYYMDFTDTVYLDGKTYAMSLQGMLVVVEETDSVPTITGVASNRGVPSLGWRFFREHLVELDGEIILILLIYQETLGVVGGVEVFRLCLHKLKWIKAERIGGKVVCLEPYGLSGGIQKKLVAREIVYISHNPRLVDGWCMIWKPTTFLMFDEENR